MADYRAPLDDMRFLLRDVFDMNTLWQSLPGLEDADTDTADTILEEMARLCQQVIAPLNRAADEAGCQWNDGQVTTPEGFREAYDAFRDGGWCALGAHPDYGGMGMPKSLVAVVDEILQSSCMAFGLAPMLTSGACLALEAHGNEALKERYLPPMNSGQWSGAMALTEAHAGTDLGIIRTRATPNGDGSYNISGTKIFITWGEHDMTENVVHLVLAKLPDAPAGSRGISMFLVPKFLVNDDGSLGERNAVNCGSLEKKMGIKASATCVMNYDGARGWLVGEAHKGLAAMFTMMNYERLGVGVQGLAGAEASYQTAVAYARERRQSRSPIGARDPRAEADPLLVHPDVRRMLLKIRALNEGGRAFYLYVARWLDIAKYAPDAERRQRAQGMVALLTPVAKAFLTDMAFEAAVDGQQVLGGHGYVREWGQEQWVRDIRITQIYEGTNGIQALDLIGRKTVATGGELLNLFVADVESFLETEQDNAAIVAYVAPLREALDTLQVVTKDLLARAAEDPCVPGAAAMDYLHLFGYVAQAYLWARMVAATEYSALSTDFLRAKRQTAHFYYTRILPQTLALTARIQQGSDSLMAMPEELF